MQQFYQNTSSYNLDVDSQDQTSPEVSGGQRGKFARQKQKGQLVLEYVLLMILAVGMAALVKNSLIGGSSEDINSSGILTKMFYNITRPIAEDEPGA